MSRPRYPIGHVWLSLAAPLLALLGLVAVLQRQGNDRLQALPAILVGIGLVISAVVGRRRRLLEYVKNKDVEQYRALIKDLGLRH